MILEIELPLLRNLEIAYIHRIKQLLVILIESQFHLRQTSQKLVVK